MTSDGGVFVASPLHLFRLVQSIFLRARVPYLIHDSEHLFPSDMSHTRAAGDGRSMRRAAARPAVTPENFFSPDTHWE